MMSLILLVVNLESNVCTYLLLYKSIVLFPTVKRLRKGTNPTGMQYAVPCKISGNFLIILVNEYIYIYALATASQATSPAPSDTSSGLHIHPSVS